MPATWITQPSHRRERWCTRCTSLQHTKKRRGEGERIAANTVGSPHSGGTDAGGNGVKRRAAECIAGSDAPSRRGRRRKPIHRLLPRRARPRAPRSHTATPAQRAPAANEIVGTASAFGNPVAASNCESVGSSWTLGGTRSGWHARSKQSVRGGTAVAPVRESSCYAAGGTGLVMGSAGTKVRLKDEV